MTERQSPAEIQVLKFAMKAASGRLLPHERVAKCLLWRIPGLHAQEWSDGKKAHFRQLQVCGSVWLCPVCSGKITERQAQLLKQAIDNHADLDVVMVVLTLRHKRRDVLAEVLRGLQESFRRFTAGRWYKEFRAMFGIVATVRSLETTHGNDNGWHPHFHVLMFLDHQLAPAEVARLKETIVARWLAVLDMEGHDGTEDHAVEVTHRRADIASYVAKFGREKKWNVEREVTKSPSKMGKTEGHKSPFALLREYAVDDNKRSGALFAEYGQVFRGRHQLQWSRGALDLLGIKELRNAEKAARQADKGLAWLLYEFTDLEWTAVRKTNALTELIRLGNTGDKQAVIDFVDSLMGSRRVPVHMEYNVAASASRADVRRGMDDAHSLKEYRKWQDQQEVEG